MVKFCLHKNETRMEGVLETEVGRKNKRTGFVTCITKKEPGCAWKERFLYKGRVGRSVCNPGAKSPMMGYH